LDDGDAAGIFFQLDWVVGFFIAWKTYGNLESVRKSSAPQNGFDKNRPPAILYAGDGMKTPGTRILSVLLLASFLYSHGDLFYAAARWTGNEKAADDCYNALCCCDRSSPDGKEAKCGMCITAPEKAVETAPGQACLYPGGCGPDSNVPVLSVNKDLRFSIASAKISFFPNTEKIAAQNSILRLIDFTIPIFHPPPA
jgi:hypothetical protein